MVSRLVKRFPLGSGTTPHAAVAQSTRLLMWRGATAWASGGGMQFQPRYQQGKHHAQAQDAAQQARVAPTAAASGRALSVGRHLEAACNQRTGLLFNPR